MENWLIAYAVAAGVAFVACTVVDHYVDTPVERVTGKDKRATPSHVAGLVFTAAVWPLLILWCAGVLIAALLKARAA